MSDPVATWLLQLGLSEYAPAFQGHAVGADQLERLDDAMLREMGIPIGPRLRLLDAIHRLSISSGTAPQSVERRQLTVMFVDLVGSTAMSGRLDPEDLRDVIRAFLGMVDSLTSSNDGYVAQYKGDGALVYFGYPRAHEDDPERAVRTAMSIVEAMKVQSAVDGRPLEVHIGIATGLAVVGDSFGHTVARERSAIGETPNLAARLVELAGPGEVVVSSQTQRLTEQLFVYEPLGTRLLKGLAPTEAFVLRAARAVDTRFDARQGSQQSPLVGRRQELEHLQSLWRLAAQGQGQVVLVAGEAGIGKSRLVRALEESIQCTPHTRIVNQCSPSHVATALHPIARQIARAAGLQLGDTAAEGLSKLRLLLGNIDEESLSLTAALVGIGDPMGAATGPDASPAERRQRTFRTLLTHLERTSAVRPVLWILEDAHWGDPSTLEMVDQYMARVATLPVLVVVTFRPEGVPPMRDAPHISRLSVPRLSAEEVASLVVALGGSDVSAELHTRIAERTDGVPLFVEEVTKSVLEMHSSMTTSGDLAAIPATLHDSLMARLDRNVLQKEVAQVAACIGREFNQKLLQSVSAVGSDELQWALTQLCSVDIVRQQGEAGEGRYAFKHALVRDAAYESLLKRRREELHARIFAELEQEQVVPAEVLARHAADAGLQDRAQALWTQAGALALSRSSFAEALSHFENALRCNEARPHEAQRAVERLDLLIALGQATIPLRGYSHSDCVAVFARADALAKELKDGTRGFWVSYARWVVYYVRGEHGTAQSIARDMLAQAEAEASSGRLLTALRSLGISYMISGSPKQADDTLSTAEQLADQVRRQPRDRRITMAQRFAADPDIATQFHVALTHWALGRFGKARAHGAKAVADARAMGHVHTLGHALCHDAILAVLDRDSSAALALCEEVAELSERHDMELWRGYGRILHGFAHAIGARLEPAAVCLQDGLARLERTQTGTMVPLHHSVCAWVLNCLGRGVEAARHEDLVMRELGRGTERYFWPEMLVWHAKTTMMQGIEGNSLAEAILQRALSEGRRQHAIGLELRAATELSRLWQGRGDRGSVVALLGPLVEHLQQERDTSPVQEALKLLG